MCHSVLENKYRKSEQESCQRNEYQYQCLCLELAKLRLKSEVIEKSESNVACKQSLAVTRQYHKSELTVQG